MGEKNKIKELQKILDNVKGKKKCKFKDIIGFIQRFMNQAASHLVNRKLLPGVLQNERF